MYKKTETLVERACRDIAGFSEVMRTYEQKLIISGCSKSTLRSYSHQLAAISLQYGKLPDQLSESQIEGYLYSLIKVDEKPSQSRIKHIVYSLRNFYRLFGYEEKLIKLPKIHRDNKLPVVLNRAECKKLFVAITHIKSRVILSLIYSAGLRVGELCRLKIADIDSGRMMIHIRQSKFGKDRYVPLSPLILKGLRMYYEICRPKVWLFNGKNKEVPIHTVTVEDIMRRAVKNAKIRKNVSVHNLRHSYATHLLEDGVDIVTIKELLGHARIESTMVYLHVAKLNRSNLYSPFDRLYMKNEAKA